MDAQSAVADHADEEIKPMDAEIPQHEIVDRLERRARYPAVIPADRDMHARDFADQPRRDGFAQPGQMRRPSAVLVDRELHPAPLGLRDELAADSQVLDEGLLRKDMLAGGERASHHIDAKLGCVVMSRTSIRGSRSCPSKSSVASAWGKNASRSPVARARSREPMDRTFSPYR